MLIYYLSTLTSWLTYMVFTRLTIDKKETIGSLYTIERGDVSLIK